MVSHDETMEIRLDVDDRTIRKIRSALDHAGTPTGMRAVENFINRAIDKALQVRVPQCRARAPLSRRRCRLAANHAGDHDSGHSRWRA